MLHCSKPGKRCVAWKMFCTLAVVIAVGMSAGAQERERNAIPTAEAFTGHVLTDGLDMPWEMLWGPDNMLWVTERHGLQITRVDPRTGEKKVVGKIPEAYPGPQHEGVLGMAFGPNFLASADSTLYVYYTMKNGDSRWGRLVRYRYDRGSEQIGDAQILMDKLPAGDDHNAGRLRFGLDGKLYLTIGEQGHNQGKNFCLPIEAQRIPTSAEVENRDWDAYRGKSLRINPDGSVPADNPVIKGVRSHVFTYGHRNPQGLTFVGGDLYSCEQGPSSDDEINLLRAGGNYGWPHVAGFRDGQGYKYANYSAAANCASLPFDANTIPDGVPVEHELEWYATDFVPPVKTFYTVRNDHNFNDSRCGGGDEAYLCWPTIAPSDIVYYPANGVIPSFRSSLLVTTLKTGALFVVRLSGDEKEVQGDYDKLFRSRNRYRAVAYDPTGRNIYIACDNSGSAKDEDGKPAAGVRNPGAILVFTYNGDGGSGSSVASRTNAAPAAPLAQVLAAAPRSPSTIMPAPAQPAVPGSGSVVEPDSVIVIECDEVIVEPDRL